MSRSFDVMVLGSEPDALVAAGELGASGKRVLLIEPEHELGGIYRELEFAPGWRAAPLVPDLGGLDSEAFRAAALPGARVEADPTVIALGEQGPVTLRRSAAETAAQLRRVSPRDADRWPKFVQQLAALSGFLAALYREAAPRIDAAAAGEFLTLLSLGRRYRRLGRSGMVELLRSLPISAADWLDDFFESPQLKGALAALAVTDLAQGPMSGGTALSFLHRHVGAPPGVIGERLRLKEGPGALIGALTRRARAAGVTIETGVAVRELLVKDGRVAAAALGSGEILACRAVVSALDPYHSLLELVDPACLDPVFAGKVRNIRFRGVTTKILVALDSLPDSVARLGDPGPCPLGVVLIAPSMRYVERAYDATKYGRSSDEPFIAMQFPSAAQAGVAPPGRHVAVLHVQYTPYRLSGGRWSELRDAVADRALAVVEAHLPGFTSRVRDRAVLTPPDLESRFGLREGAVSCGELALDQMLFMRPVPEAAGDAAAVAGLYLCGAGAHPGPGIVGASGRLAARAVLEDLT
ncbi:MAG TPA: NAD(P)/FAD-dependent oxidoreductase [Steroidobacteraceae bacterium]|nr:NAD(P)/FAD-dependent oxidoreductase [Steroidobacteraceae bacterium]